MIKFNGKRQKSSINKKKKSDWWDSSVIRNRKITVSGRKAGLNNCCAEEKKSIHWDRN